jgi:hypothetical protein
MKNRQQRPSNEPCLTRALLSALDGFPDYIILAPIIIEITRVCLIAPISAK